MRRKTHLEDGVLVCRKESDVFVSTKTICHSDAAEGKFASMHIQIDLFAELWRTHKGRSDIQECLLGLDRCDIY